MRVLLVNRGQVPVRLSPDGPPPVANRPRRWGDDTRAAAVSPPVVPVVPPCPSSQPRRPGRTGPEHVRSTEDAPCRLATEQRARDNRRTSRRGRTSAGPGAGADRRSTTREGTTPSLARRTRQERQRGGRR